MLRIRFSRVGKRNAPSFRLVLTPKESPPKGKFLEILGFYNPRTKERGLKKERILHWISKGAAPSDTAHNFLVKEGVIEGKKIAVHSMAKRKKKAAADSSAKAPAKEEAPTEEVPQPEADPPRAEKEETPVEEAPTEEAITES